MLFVLYLTATKIAIFVFLPTATCAFHLMGLLHFIRRNTYHHVFFDLDRTLWDFERNRDLTLGQMYVEHRLERVFGSLQTFSECYCRHNDRLWGYYGRHEIDKPTLRFKRFYDTLREFGLDDPTLAHTLDADYIGLMPSHNALVDGAAELLCYLSERNYQLHIITNGFSEVQSPKLERAGVLQHFQWVITSEQSGFHKPDPRAFGYALAKANARKRESIMVGDNFEADIMGAMRFGMAQIYFNPNGAVPAHKPTHEVQHLLQIRNIL